MKLLECCKINSKRVQEFQGIKSYVATGDVDENNIINLQDVTFENKPSRANLQIKENNVLFAKMMNTKKVIIGNEENVDYIYSTGFYCMEANENVILPKLLYYFLNSDIFNKQKDKNCTGATMKAINDKGLESITLKVPALEEQRKIIAEFDNLYKLLELRRKMIEDCQKFIESDFVEQFGKIKESKFETISLKDLVNKNDSTSLKRGPFGGSLKKEDFVEEGYLVYEQRHAIHNDFEYEKYYISKEKYESMKMFMVKPKDLIISCSGATLGRIAEVPENAKEGIINQALLKLTLNNDIILNTFFIQQFRSNEMQNQLFGFSRGAGIPNFPSMTEVKKLQFICPPIKEQEDYVKRVKGIESLIECFEKDELDIKQLINKKMKQYFEE